MTKERKLERPKKRDVDHGEIDRVIEENPPPVRTPRASATDKTTSEEANAFDKRPWDWRW